MNDTLIFVVMSQTEYDVLPAQIGGYSFTTPITGANPRKIGDGKDMIAVTGKSVSLENSWQTKYTQARKHALLASLVPVTLGASPQVPLDDASMTTQNPSPPNSQLQYNTVYVPLDHADMENVKTLLAPYYDQRSQYYIPYAEFDTLIDTLSTTTDEVLKPVYVSFMKAYVGVLPLISFIEFSKEHDYKYNEEAIIDELVADILKQDANPQITRGGKHKGGKLPFTSWYKKLKAKLKGGSRVAPYTYMPNAPNPQRNHAQNGQLPNSQTPVLPFNAQNDQVTSPRPQMNSRAEMSTKEQLNRILHHQPELALRLIAEKRLMDFEDFIKSLPANNFKDIYQKLQTWKQSFKELHQNPIFLTNMKTFFGYERNLRELGAVSSPFARGLQQAQKQAQKPIKHIETSFISSMKHLLDFINEVNDPAAVNPSFDVEIHKKIKEGSGDVHISYTLNTVRIFGHDMQADTDYQLNNLQKAIESGIYADKVISIQRYSIYDRKPAHSDYPKWRNHMDDTFTILYDLELAPARLDNEWNIDHHVHFCYDIMMKMVDTDAHYSFQIHNWCTTQCKQIYQQMAACGHRLISLITKKPQEHFLTLSPVNYNIRMPLPFSEPIQKHVQYIHNILSTPVATQYPYNLHGVLVCMDKLLLNLIHIFDRASPLHQVKYFEVNRFRLFQILYMRYIPGVSLLEEKGQELLTFLLDEVLKDFPMTDFANDKMYDTVINRYQEMYNTTTDKNLKLLLHNNLQTLIKTFVTDRFFYGSTESEKGTIAEHIHESVKAALSEEKPLDLTSTNLNINLNNSPHLQSKKEPILYDPSSPLTLTPGLTLRDTQYSPISNNGGVCYAQHMVLLMSNYNNYLNRKVSYSDIFAGVKKEEDTARYMIDTKHFTDELLDIFKGASHDIYTTLEALKTQATGDDQWVRNIITIGRHPPTQGGGNKTRKAATYFVLRGRRYKVHKEGRKHIIKTTNGIIALTEAKKLQSKYLKEKQATKKK
jgi:hypothetical protein